MSKKFKPIEELTIRDNFMFVKVFSNPEIALPFLRALLKIEIEKVSIVGEAQQQADPRKKYVRFDVLVRENGADGTNNVGRVFDLEKLKDQYVIFLCPEDIFGKERPIYEFENREKNDHSLALGDHTYKFFLNFSRYGAVTDESVRDYLKYFATGEATSDATRAIQNQVNYYHKDPKTRSDYMTFKAMLEEEREEGRAEGESLKNRELAKGFRDDGVPLEIISKRTGLTPEEIKAL